MVSLVARRGNRAETWRIAICTLHALMTRKSDGLLAYATLVTWVTALIASFPVGNCARNWLVFANFPLPADAELCNSDSDCTHTETCAYQNGRYECACKEGYVRDSQHICVLMVDGLCGGK